MLAIYAAVRLRSNKNVDRQGGSNFLQLGLLPGNGGGASPCIAAFANFAARRHWTPSYWQEGTSPGREK